MQCRAKVRRDSELYATNYWGSSGGSADIIAYRLHKPEPASAPTIDQLLQDWRNADDYAQRKQAEADEAAAMRDERWMAVQVRAGEFSVTVGRCDSATKADQNLAITDWRDLKNGDVVMVVYSSNPAWRTIDGVELVVRIDGDTCEDVHFGPWCMSDNTDWVFIRRP